MALLHVLEGSGLNTYRIVLHVPTPAGNNPAGIAWSEALKNSGRAHSLMIEGNGAGQIHHQELNKVENGELIEASFNFTFDPLWSPAQRAAALDAGAVVLAAETIVQLRDTLKWFGSVRV